MEFHEFLLLGRNRARLTQKELGARVGANRASISLWEGGARKPSIIKFCELTKAFGWSDAEIAAAVKAAR